MRLASMENHGTVTELFPVPSPIAPHVGPILEIHRGADSFVTFYRKVNDEWEDLGALRVADLERMFPQFTHKLLVDSYFSVNSFFRDRRRQRDCRYLNAAFVDIDAREIGITAGTLFGRAYDAIEAQRLPVPSLFSLSGRGVWFFWLLTDGATAGLPVRAWPEKVVAYQNIQRELIRRLSADIAAKDISRVTRVPGSINSKSDTAVAYGIFRARFGTPEYTLERLSAALGLEMPQLRPNRRRSSASPEASARGLSGWRALWQQRHEAFELLHTMRGGFRKGHRNRAAYLYAVILQGCGFTDDALRAAVTQLGLECRPPLSAREIEGAIAQSRRSRGWLREETIAGHLEVTSEEAQRIPRWNIHSTPGTGEPIDMHLTRTGRIELRKQIILEIVSELGGHLPSTREMVRLLRARGIGIGHVQVSTYYHQLRLRADNHPQLLLAEGEENTPPLSPY